MRVLLIFGGWSAEHKISVRSAVNVYRGLKRGGHDVFDICITRKGLWKRGCLGDLVVDPSGLSEVKSFEESDECFALVRDDKVRLIKTSGELVYNPDVVFPVIHGASGEDGTLQGLFRQVNIPFVGCDVCASACTMDKDITKRLLSFAGIRVARGYVITGFEVGDLNFGILKSELGESLFIKPASSGSSLGASVVNNAVDYDQAVRKALGFGSKVLVEEYLIGREFEFAIIGNREIIVSPPGEIIVHDGFYNYDKKYISGDVRCEVPANLDRKVIEDGQRIARGVYTTLGCEGLARIDFFLVNDCDWVVNEVNTMPGFTDQSLYSRLFALMGQREDLFDKLLELAITR